MGRIAGIILFVFGFWFIGQNIIISSSFSLFSWQGVSAGGAVILMAIGVIGAFTGNEEYLPGYIGSIIASIILVYVTGTIVIYPTSFAEVFIGTALMGVGLRLIQNINTNF